MVSAIVVGLVAVTGWLAFRVLTVKAELEAGLGEVAAIQNGGDPRAGITRLATHASAAVAATSDPLWGLSEGIPWVGDNLRAARVAAESGEFLSRDLALPAIDAFEQDGQAPLLGRVVPVLSAAAPRGEELAAQLAEIAASPSLVGPVRSGVGTVATMMRTAATALKISPGMLGADGPRTYLIVAQNNAESLALGGSAASETLVRVGADGAVEVVAQADSQDYDNGRAVDVPIDQSAIDLYNEYLVTHVNTTVGRPDFPTAARLLMAFWQRDISPDRIDGVVSIDPIALAGVLKATGPVKVSGWKEITSENVVRTVLSDAYAISPDPDISDRLFKRLALAVFDKVSTGAFRPTEMVTAVRNGINGGSIQFWSADEETQRTIAGLRVGGVLPTDNVDQTTVGVYFRDASMGSKIDYYMTSATKVRATCTADGRTKFRVRVTMGLDLSQEQADALPKYVKSGVWGSSKFRTQVFVYGPPGTTVTYVRRQHSTRDWNWRPAVGTFDLGRPVVAIMMNQTPGGTNTMEAVFEGRGSFGPVKVRTTPMVRTTQVTRSDHRCGAG